MTISALRAINLALTNIGWEGLYHEIKYLDSTSTKRGFDGGRELGEILSNDLRTVKKVLGLEMALPVQAGKSFVCQ